MLGKILVNVLLANDLANVGKKNELELASLHMGVPTNFGQLIQTRTKFLAMSKKMVRLVLYTNQTWVLAIK